MPIDHVNLPVGDLGASRAFYRLRWLLLGTRSCTTRKPRSALAAATAARMTSRSRSSGDPPSVGSHVAFTASSPDQVNEFHTAALAAGGRDNGAPGERPYGGDYYAAFVLDPDGHNIEAVYHERSA